MKAISFKILIPDFKWAVLEADDYSEQDIIELLMRGAKHRLNLMVESIEEKIESEIQSQAEDDIEHALGTSK